MKLRIVVADDNPGFLEKFIALLGTEFDVVATASNGSLALQAIRQFEPDVAVLDLGMPELNGIEVMKELRRSNRGAAVVICSIETDPQIVRTARQAGVLGYVFKSRVEKDLIAAVKAAARGESFFLLE